MFLILPVIITALLSSTMAETPQWIDSAEAQYSIAATEYDNVRLQKTAEFILQNLTSEQQLPKGILLLGLTYWHQELIAYCLDTPSDVSRYGKLAIKQLNAAEKAGADSYLTASHKALACLLLASQSLGQGILYGPRSAKELKKAQSANPRGYFTLLVEAINLSQAPSFVGGNPQRAVVLLENMMKVFPDSIDVKIHLTAAYFKIGRISDARRLIAPIVNSNPRNLLGRKIAGMLPAN
jgi:predicted Zn-dependent protease